MAGLAELAAGFDVKLDQRQSEAFARYYDMLCEWNQRVRLVGNTAAQEIRDKFFLDSLVLGETIGLNSAEMGCRLADVVSGAGFPGVPIAIGWPAVNVTLIESVRKKAGFLQSLSELLDLSNVTTLCERAEMLGQSPDHREMYDYALVRTVGRISLTAELCLPLVKLGGRVATPIRSDRQSVVECNRATIRLLGGELAPPFEIDVPGFAGHRRYVVIEKRWPTPNRFPRRSSQLGSPAS